MKKSNIVMICAIGVLLVLMTIFIISVRVSIFPKDRQTESNSDEFLENADWMKMNLKNFDEIHVSNSWNVKIEQNEKFSVEIIYPEGTEDDLNVFVDDSMLYLDGKNSNNYSSMELKAVIMMPSIQFLSVDGAADVLFTGFDEQQMEIRVEGVANVESKDSSVNTLSVILSGLGHVNLEDLESFNADVRLEGLGSINLNMSGGVLKGRLEGLGSIEYSGNVSDERIRIDGLGSVDQVD